MFGGLCRTVWCGVSGENGIREALRIVNGPFLSLSLFSLLNGVWFYLLFLVFPFLGCLGIVLWFLDVFVFLVHFLCTGLCFFNILLSYLSKKKISWKFFIGNILSICQSVDEDSLRLPNLLLYNWRCSLYFSYLFMSDFDLWAICHKMIS